MKYKGIIFDLDGVLCSTDRFHFEAWKQTAEEVGAPFDETINMKLRGVSRMESLEIILSGSSKTFTDAEKERLATSKPDPEVFTKAAAMVGLDPADCLVVEDAAAGLEAARAGGMDCAIVGTAPMPFEPTYHMQDVTKLPGTIL